MTEYQIAFSMYGTLNGFANLPRDFTDVLFSQKSTYIAAVYKEFYGQLFFRDIISVKDDIPSTNANEIPSLDEDMPEEIYNSAQSQIDQDFDNFMRELTAKCSGAKKDETLYKSFYKKHGGVTIGFVEDVKQCTDFCKGKGVQKYVINYLDKLVKSLSKEDPSLVTNDVKEPQLFDSLENNGSLEPKLFIYDTGIADVVRNLKISDRKIEEKLIEDLRYVQKKHANQDQENIKCIKHFKHLVFSQKTKYPLKITDENKRIISNLVSILKQRYE